MAEYCRAGFGKVSRTSRKGGPEGLPFEEHQFAREILQWPIRKLHHANVGLSIPDPRESPMHTLLGFELDVWDYVAFAAMFALVVAGLAVAVLVLGLPGRIAISRKHPEAEAVNLMGWAGFLTVVPWLKALGWAFKPTDVIDIRYFPHQEQQDINVQIGRLTGRTVLKSAPEQLQPKAPPVNDQQE
jgi:hypothetical protein